MTTTQRYAYGDDPSQWCELFLPERPTAAGVAVVVHGGYWKSPYGAELGAPLAADLAGRGIPAWNLEYRRLGNGGGWPETFQDVADGIDLLRVAAAQHRLDLGRVVALGHSAGGHLATWAAGRPDPLVALTAVVSQSGLLDLGAAADLHLDDDAVLDLLGATRSEAPDRYLAASPIEQLPIGVPVYAVHTEDDATVPMSQSAGYVARALATGSPAELHTIAGDHFVLIDVTTPAYALCRSLVERALAG